MATDAELAAMPYEEWRLVDDEITEHWCGDGSCPKGEKMPDGSLRYAIAFDSGTYKWGSITDRLTGEVFGGVRKPDEDGASCHIVGCPIIEWLASLWEVRL